MVRSVPNTPSQGIYTDEGWPGPDKQYIITLEHGSVLQLWSFLLSYSSQSDYRFRVTGVLPTTSIPANFDILLGGRCIEQAVDSSEVWQVHKSRHDQV